VYTDRGAAFTAWRDVTSCEQFLDEQLIDHSLRKAHRPQGGGKIEAVIVANVSPRLEGSVASRDRGISSGPA
ncbi:MAG TPA: hypothetical protein VLM79_26930, partial [Kofleriaceae bacterium]|nr:hypothetical protein [Kofleriaceae bacterium]